jgi:hypothetical protein
MAYVNDDMQDVALMENDELFPFCLLLAEDTS